MNELLTTISSRIGDGISVAAERIPLVLAEPRSYPREAMLLAVIVGLGLLFLVTAGMAVWDAIAYRVEIKRSGLAVRRTGAWERRLIVPAILLLAVAFVAIAPVFRFASRPVCGSCHATKQAVASWRSSAHSSTACYGCHAAPGITGAIEASFQGAARRLTGASQLPATTVDSRGCLSCHREILTKVVGDQILVSHKEIEQAGIACIACHEGIGHDAERSEDAIARKTMTRCLVCHDGDRAQAECGVCHASNPSDAARVPSGPLSPIAITCDGGCHSDELDEQCLSCHGLELPHPEGFTREHAGLSANDPALCARCHEAASAAQSCTCHEDGAVHGSYSEWFATHGAAAAQNGPGGCNCHDKGGYSFCAKCHDENPW